jgi:hypothetical protein
MSKGRSTSHNWGPLLRSPEKAISSQLPDGTFPYFFEARWPRFAPVPCIFRLVTPVLRALTWVSPNSEGDSPRCHSYRAIDRLAPSGPGSPRPLRFPFRESSSGPIHFSLDLIPRQRYNMTTLVIYKITKFFDNLTRAQLLAICQLLSQTNQTKAKTFVRRVCCRPERNRDRPDRHANPNV